ncbi:hypothetical protein Back11_41670 [Paenibacillus baekrokdamisoli]|uniref:Uncharacterized protein n=1 Tax=Paenibacillus baekrokdamisoli TaxID=1712516 RepID=A0A3G9IWY8_9BACL|nr:hypothetical protein [Paenibacillus baekrokdamisoli]MBB3068134.1 hypothetical protein [Paenibacillus baekrokdamisoli]BBH22822.1 hypothetical protein Back11_41670 [Paenibacillus baekrokdamisoli]
METLALPFDGVSAELEASLLLLHADKIKLIARATDRITDSLRMTIEYFPLGIVFALLMLAFFVESTFHLTSPLSEKNGINEIKIRYMFLTYTFVIILS